MIWRKATGSMIIAGASAAKEDETAVFMTGEAVWIATKGGVDGSVATSSLQLHDGP
jgi:predicted peroxiredoxin